MIQLLKFIVSFLSVLFDEYGFLIKESKNSGNRFSGASILLTSSDVEIFLAIERDEITACFRSMFDKQKSNWYSAEVVLSLLGYQDCLGIMNNHNSLLLRNKIPEVMRRFSESEFEKTLRQLDEIEKRVKKGKRATP